MKTVLLSVCTLFCSLGAFAQAEGVTVTVTLENVLSDQGEILAAIHREDTFMRGPGMDNYKGAAQAGQVVLVFENVPPGTYAVSVLHDLNANGRMDFEPSGMPKEPYAMSGNIMEMGPPTFAGSSFEVGGENVSISLRF